MQMVGSTDALTRECSKAYQHKTEQPTCVAKPLGAISSTQILLGGYFLKLHQSFRECYSNTAR